MSQLRLHPALTRLDAARLRLDSPAQVPATLFARPDVPVEPEAVCEALAFLSTQEDLARAGLGRIERLVLTPDFHRGSGIPVGTVARTQGCVLPRAVGSDVYCGMRLVALDARGEELDAALPRLAPPLREVFFGGRRDLPTSPAQREALLLGGLPALLGTSDNWERGSWRWLDVRRERADLARAHFSGGIQTSGLFVFADWVRGSGSTDGRDAQLGSFGGGGPPPSGPGAGQAPLRCRNAPPGSDQTKLCGASETSLEETGRPRTSDSARAARRPRTRRLPKAKFAARARAARYSRASLVSAPRA